MSILDNFHFIRPIWLSLIPVLAWLWLKIRQASDPFQNLRNVIEPELLEAMTVGKDKRQRWEGSGLLLGWVVAIIAVAGPTWRPEPSPFADDPVPVMLLLKASDTMNQSDLVPSRMERARLKIVDFANERKGQPLGLIAYSGTSHLVLPPTRDTSVVATMAAEIASSIMPKPGDDLPSALALAASTLRDSGGSIVVMADTVPVGSDLQFAQFQSENRLPIHFLAIARTDTPEETDLMSAASLLNASVTMLTADDTDVESIVRRTAKAPVAVKNAGEGNRWAEAGWWLVPFIVVLALIAFRREEQSLPEVSV